jgi:Cys-tRNA(Pro)/Cys-tRNA(Cys) deacylase
MAANNVTRMLDSRKIHYQAFEVSAEKLGALEVAEILKIPPGDVYKTIVAKRAKPGKPILAVVPGPLEVDTKKLAAALGEKKAFITSLNEAEALTGLQAGGISPLALINKGFQVLIDASAQEKETILISAGQRGLQVRLSPEDLAKLCTGGFAEITG